MTCLAAGRRGKEFIEEDEAEECHSFVHIVGVEGAG
jgi:hypothetical protein